MLTSVWVYSDKFYENYTYCFTRTAFSNARLAFI